MSKIHVLPDENLGGVLREYVEVDRPAKEGDLIIFREDGYDITAGRPYRVIDSRSYANLVIFIDDADERHGCGKLSERFFVIEPTDIVRLREENGAEKRYRLVDRKAKVGEKVIVVNADDINFEGYKNGDIFIVNEVRKQTVDTNKKYVTLYHYEYNVLEPVEPAEDGDDVLTVDETEASKSVLDLLANLARRVTELERQQKENREYIIKAFESISGKDDEYTVEERVARLERTFTEYMRRVNTIETDIEELNTDLATIEENVEMALDDIVTLDERTQPLVNPFVITAIPTFKYSDLIGKTLKIYGARDDDYVTVLGYEESTGKSYVLFSGKEGGERR